MNQYGSQLKGWAIDRALELAKANNTDPSVAEIYTPQEIIAKAMEFIEFAYSPDEDFRNAVARMIEVLKASAVDDALLKVRELLAELQYIEEDLTAKSNLRATLPTEQKEKEVANDSGTAEA